ncbi:putative phospholipid ABC transporter permease protein MlaE [Fundidesulfovibrio magnetotacticus]|uniref:Putative phospholipid ABC transporter permease protein MlaE n=1 Tax=Fundidesulfovibrio magnetotacticus TaxID=2730080 RepID=A0A6V8M3L9_9BACT|nr:ABC transporter permease [Fundidesulfovibrio magnetotacticus]GFK95065.1 putative phospholipid ABC transporter permease protein MlaE [Fundidesulfovibrio magnetotacticus]
MVTDPEAPPANPVTRLGAASLDAVASLGSYAVFTARGLWHMVSLPWQWSKVVRQVYFVGVKSVLVIALIGLFTGMVLGLQGYYTLVKFGAEGLLGAAVSLSVIRELGPVLTAIMVAGRAGSSMAAELGIMRISEQIDALDAMDVDPVRYLAGPRFAAALVSFPLLTAMFDVIAMIGGHLTGVTLLGVGPGVYWGRIHDSVVLEDVTGGFVKALVFALLVASVSCWQGFYAHRRPGGFGARGVGLATTSAVVASCVAILAGDYVLTSFLM